MLDIETLDVHGVVKGFEKGLDGIDMPFEAVSNIFHLIESNTKMLIVPINDEVSDMVDKLCCKIESHENFR